MQILLSLCEDYANEHSDTFNADESECSILKPRTATPFSQAQVNQLNILVAGCIWNILFVKMRMITSVLLPGTTSSLATSI